MTARARPRWAVPAVALALAVVVTVVLLARPDRYVASPGADAGDRPRTEPAEAAAALRHLEEAVGLRDVAAAVGLAADGPSEALLEAVVANAGALDVRDFTMRYVDETGPVGADATWTAAVDMTWRFDGFDRDPVHQEVLVEFDGTGPGTSIAGIGGGDRRSPLWLTAALEVRRSPDTLVLAARPAADADRYASLARRAVPAVRRVLPEWPGGLVVEVPATASDLDAMLAAQDGAYANIAAVATSVDGTITPSSPMHVFVNPELFDGLGPVGEQVVMTHEATHIATSAPVTAGLPLWILEGFADYVALRDTTLPIGEAAGQVIEQVRTDGPPAALPGPADFDPTATHLGAAYEAAWLACEVVADLAGEPALVRLYRDLSEGRSLRNALRDHVGLTERELTSRWRQRLTDLAADARVRR